MATIVLGYDASPGAERALDTALEIATHFGDRLLIAFGAAPPGPPTDEAGEHRHALEELGARVTAGALERARDAGVDAEVELVPKRPSAALTEIAEREDARMIVVGTYGESPIRGAILGSTPHKLLHLSDRPVLVVPGG
jgi:nucleotide-binding universal stress UspA family protein